MAFPLLLCIHFPAIVLNDNNINSGNTRRVPNVILTFNTTFTCVPTILLLLQFLIYLLTFTKGEYQYSRL